MIINKLQSIVQEVDIKANADSITSGQKSTVTNKLHKPKLKTGQKSCESLASQRYMARLAKFKRFMTGPRAVLESKQVERSGNNPLYAYPSIPPHMPNDPKYSRNGKNITKFVTKTVVNGELINPLETVGKEILIISRTSL